MTTLTIIVHLIASIVLIIAVLLQVGKGASIGSTFGGGSSSQTLFGSAGPATFLTKVTWTCAAIFMLTSLYLTYNSSRAKSSSIMSGISAAKPVKPAEAPAAPVAPAQGAPVQGVPAAPQGAK